MAHRADTVRSTLVELDLLTMRPEWTRRGHQRHGNKVPVRPACAYGPRAIHGRARPRGASGTREGPRRGTDGGLPLPHGASTTARLEATHRYREEHPLASGDSPRTWTGDVGRHREAIGSPGKTGGTARSPVEPSSQPDSGNPPPSCQTIRGSRPMAGIPEDIGCHTPLATTHSTGSTAYISQYRYRSAAAPAELVCEHIITGSNPEEITHPLSRC